MACLSCIKAKKACVFDQDASACQRCIRLGKICVPKPPYKSKRNRTPKSTKVISSKLHLHKNARMKSDPGGSTYQVDGMKSDPGGSTYQVDGHVTPTSVTFNDMLPAPIITNDTLSTPISHNIKSLGNRWIPPQPSQFEAQFNQNEVLKRIMSNTVNHSSSPTISATPPYYHT